MTTKGIKVFKVSLGLYFLVGGVISLYFALTTLGLFGILQSLFPAIITIIVISLFILSGYKYAFSESASATLLMKISLWIQSVQLVLLGLSFKNYFGPYFAVGFTDTPDFKFQIHIEPLITWFGNGLNKLSDEVSIVFNLIAVVLLILVYRVELAEEKLNADLNGIDIGKE